MPSIAGILQLSTLCLLAHSFGASAGGGSEKFDINPAATNTSNKCAQAGSNPKSFATVASSLKSILDFGLYYSKHNCSSLLLSQSEINTTKLMPQHDVELVVLGPQLSKIVSEGDFQTTKAQDDLSKGKTDDIAKNDEGGSNRAGSEKNITQGYSEYGVSGNYNKLNQLTKSEQQSDRPPFYWWVTMIGVPITLLLTIGNTIYSINSSRFQSRKSVYDDFWFREIFYKPLYSGLIDFRKVWGRREFGIMQMEIHNGHDGLINKYLDDVARLRDLSVVIDVVAQGKGQELESILDKFDEMLVEENYQEIYTEILNSINQKVFEIHELLKSSGYKSTKGTDNHQVN